MLPMTQRLFFGSALILVTLLSLNSLSPVIASEVPELNGDWSAADYDGPLIEDMEDARLVWKSETTGPARGQVRRYGSNLSRFLSRGLATGGSSPVMAEGRIFFQYFEPVGDAVSGGAPRRTVADMWKTHARDVVLALDAATGRTLWRAEIPRGRYYPDMSGRDGSTKGWWSPKPVVADGRLFVTTTRDVTYCFDAQSGELLWHRPFSGSIHTVIDGVLLPSAQRDLIGYDTATGEQLWRHEHRNARRRAPLHWQHGGRDYALVGYSEGVFCLDPRSGAVLWEIEGLGNNQDNDLPILRGDILIAATKTDGGLAAFRLSADGASTVWELAEPLVRDYRLPYIADDQLLLIRHGYKEGGASTLLRLADGSVVNTFTFPAGTGFIYRLGERLLVQQDSSHSNTELYFFALNGNQPHQMGSIWSAPHRHTSGYWPTPLSHIIADGRVIIRGARGIFAYDIRSQPQQ